MRRSGLLSVLVAGALGLSAAAGERQPWPEDGPAAKEESGRPRSAAGLFMWVYKHHISQVDAIRTCRFAPTCGDYARQAMASHGPLLGWIMGCERAIRYHGDTRTYRRVLIDGETRFLDPVSDNDFWLRDPPRKRKP